jgi:hypothetical protein
VEFIVCRLNLQFDISRGIPIGMRFSTFVALVFLALPSPTKVEQSGNWTNPPDISTVSGFRELCASVDKPFKQQTQQDMWAEPYCLGWMNGLAKGILLGEISHGKITEVCFPKGNSFGQMLRIVNKYIDQHPEWEHRGTEVLAMLALKDAFPCQK